MAKREKRNKSRGSAGNNRKMGKDFLEKNRHKEGVRETESGLQYLVLEEGEGDYPDANVIINVHQRCQLVNGTIIEDTYRENKTSEVKMEELIEGYRIIVENLIEKVSLKLHVTSMTFTSFWEHARVGDPILVNILRDGIALHDRGFFDPLQRILK